MNSNLIENILRSQVDWEPSAESPYLFQATVEGMRARLRLNDFPDEPLCALIVEGTEQDLHEFPPIWKLPRLREQATSQ